jgi:hypothetical protein
MTRIDACEERKKGWGGGEWDEGRKKESRWKVPRGVLITNALLTRDLDLTIPPKTSSGHLSLKEA